MQNNKLVEIGYLFKTYLNLILESLFVNKLINKNKFLISINFRITNCYEYHIITFPINIQIVNSIESNSHILQIQKTWFQNSQILWEHLSL